MVTGTMPERGMAVASDGQGNAAVVEFWKPLVWSAIIGGTVAALGVQVILTLLGIGVGAAMTDRALNPGVQDVGPGIAAMVWLVVSGIISFGVGGYVAGLMSGVVRTGSGALHGMLAWALAAVIGTTVTAMAGSATLGGAAAGAGASMAGRDIRSMASGMTAGLSNRVDSAAGGADTGDMNGSANQPNRGGSPNADVNPDDPQARAAAERAAKAVARTALLTGLAFFLSMTAAAVGGTMGRRGLDGDGDRRRTHDRDGDNSQV